MSTQREPTPPADVGTTRAGGIGADGIGTGATATGEAHVRDPFAREDLLADALRRPMSERLELALNWNKLASELQIGLAKAREREAEGA